MALYKNNHIQIYSGIVTHRGIEFAEHLMNAEERKTRRIKKKNPSLGKFLLTERLGETAHTRGGCKGRLEEGRKMFLLFLLIWEKVYEPVPKNICL